MDLLTRGLVAVFSGFLASLLHYLKKRYIDLSTKDRLRDYFLWSDPYVRNAVGTLMFAEVSLAYSSLEQIMNFDLFVSFLSTGYATDSIFNRSSEQQGESS